MRFLTMLLLVVMLTLGAQAQAASRLGGGKSIGKQSSNVTQRQASPQPATPAPGSPAASPAPAPAQPAAAPARRPWGAMLGGLAAGLGLAWLAHSLGMGEGFGQILMFALLAFVVVALVSAFLRSRRPPAPSGGLAYAGAGASANAPATAVQYSPDKVGNDASARPWERNSMSFEASRSQPEGGLRIGSALAGPQTWGIPAGFDADGFVTAAKRNFVTLQDAWDRSDIPALRSMMTDEMVAEIQSQLSERERHTGGRVNKTEVVMLEAKLLGIEDIADAHLASVEFSGLIREDPSSGPSPFREVWNMTKPRNGATGWLVAGVQALQ